MSAATAPVRNVTGKPLPSALKVGLSRTGLEVKQFFREKEQLIFTFFFPIIFLGIFSAVFGDTDFGGGVNAATYFTPGMIASGIFLTSFQSLAITIAMERDEDLLKRLRGTPMSPQSYFIGKIGLVLVTSIAQFGLLLAIAGLAARGGRPDRPVEVADLPVDLRARYRVGVGTRDRVLGRFRGPARPPPRSSPRSSCCCSSCPVCTSSTAACRPGCARSPRSSR